ncbi:MAG: peroxidase-related enzyme [Flavobacteriales bacterium]|nr:peroxidase-related enzyme [Flavobacteriales bacterium]
MSFIEVIEEQEAEGRLKEIYDDLIASRGKLADVHKIQSLNPESIKLHMDFYIHLLYGKSPLKRYQREMIAVVVSVANKCKYCTRHHGEALNHYWRDKEKLEQFIANHTSVGLSDADIALCNYARDLTIAPNSIKEDNQIKALKSNDFDDRAILDTAMIINYFNFVSRMILGLGVNLEEDGGKGYRF